MDTIAVEQLKYIHNTLERMSVRQEETNRLLARILEQYEWANKQFIECPNGEARELMHPDLGPNVTYESSTHEPRRFWNEHGFEVFPGTELYDTMKAICDSSLEDGTAIQ